MRRLEAHTSDDQSRERIAQVFRYLHDLNLHRNPAKRLIQDQPWRLSLSDLPDDPSIKRVTVDIPSANDDGGQTTPPYLLKVDRPKLSAPPPPPDSLPDWLERGWDDPLSELRVRPSRNETNARGDTVVVAFDESPKRVALLDEWKAARTQWASNERPARSLRSSSASL
jgi:hypothetical protein